MSRSAPEQSESGVFAQAVSGVRTFGGKYYWNSFSWIDSTGDTGNPPTVVDVERDFMLAKDWADLDPVTQFLTNGFLTRGQYYTFGSWNDGTQSLLGDPDVQFAETPTDAFQSLFPSGYQKDHQPPDSCGWIFTGGGDNHAYRYPHRSRQKFPSSATCFTITLEVWYQFGWSDFSTRSASPANLALYYPSLAVDDFTVAANAWHEPTFPSTSWTNPHGAFSAGFLGRANFTVRQPRADWETRTGISL